MRNRSIQWINTIDFDEGKHPCDTRPIQKMRNVDLWADNIGISLAKILHTVTQSHAIRDRGGGVRVPILSTDRVVTVATIEPIGLQWFTQCGQGRNKTIWSEERRSELALEFSGEPVPQQAQRVGPMSAQGGGYAGLWLGRWAVT